MKVLRHPLTGAPLVPLYTDKYGVAHWPIMGASETPPEGGAGGAQGGASGEPGPNSGGGSGDGGTGTGTQSGATTEETVSKQDLESALQRMQAADRRASQAELELKALKDKDLDEKTRAEQAAEEARTALAAAQDVIKSLRLENAFLSDRNYTWNDPSDILRFVRDDERVSIGEDGKVSGLEAALKDLATKKPYLVKKEEGGNLPGPSGAPMGGGGNGSGKEPDRSKLETTYPSLRGRGTRK